MEDGERDDLRRPGEELRLETGGDIAGGDGEAGFTSSFSSGCLIMLLDCPDMILVSFSRMMNCLFPF